MGECMKENAIQEHPNQSFVVEIKSTENQTWQGSVTWIEGKKKEYFRSGLELVRLLDSAITKHE